MEKVLLFKSPDNSITYQQILQSNGFTSMFIPVLEFVYINLDELLNKLKDHDKYYGLVLTSQRAVDGIKRCLIGNDAVLENWKTKPIFVVGEATGKKLFTELRLTGSAVQPGNSGALADYIIKENSKDVLNKPLLFPCANIKSDVLPTKLKGAGIGIDCVDVYTTQENHDFKESLRHLQNGEGIPDILIFFSPSGVEFSLPVLKDLGYNFDTCKIISIGPSTGRRIIDLGLSLYAIAEEPSPSAILECLAGLDKQFSPCIN